MAPIAFKAIFLPEIILYESAEDFLRKKYNWEIEHVEGENLMPNWLKIGLIRQLARGEQADLSSLQEVFEVDDESIDESIIWAVKQFLRMLILIFRQKHAQFFAEPDLKGYMKMQRDLAILKDQLRIIISDTLAAEIAKNLENEGDQISWLLNKVA